MAIDIRDVKYEDYFHAINTYSDSISEYTPVNLHLLKAHQYQQIARTNAQMPYIISQWQGHVGQNSSSVIVATASSKAETTLQNKKRLQVKVYDFLYTKLNWKKIELAIVQLIAEEANAVVMLNSVGEIIVHSIFRFSVYYESSNKIKRYAFKDKNGAEIKEMSNLRHGIDLYHIQDPTSSNCVISPSRLDACFAFILLEQKGVKANTALFANGFLMNVFLKLNPDILPKLQDQSKDKNGKTFWERFMSPILDRFSGVEKAGRVGYIPGLEGIFETGKNNRDSQFHDIIKELTPERVAWAYSMTLSDFGAGGNTTYNNATTFNDALYDKIGRPLESILDDCRNNFLLKTLFGVPISSSLYIKYNEPEDPNKLLEVESWRNDFIAGVITANEYREKRGLEPIEGAGKLQLTAENEAKNEEEITEEQVFTVDFSQKKTPIQSALDSKKYKKFNEKWDKALNKQLETFLSKFEQLDSTDYKHTPKLPKIESFYSFNDLKSNILEFAKLGLEEIKKDKRIKFSVGYSDEEYPQSILDFIENRTEALLKGNAEFKSIDVETASQIETIISENINLGVLQIAEKIKEAIPELVSHRAELIAHQEVSNAIEGSRELMYLESFGDQGLKAWITVGDEFVRDGHQKNEKQGKIKISEKFESGDSSPASAFRCRCTATYYPPL